MLIPARTNTAGRLVQGEIHLAAGPDDSTVHHHLVALRIHPGPQQTDDVPVDANQPVQNQLLTRAAGSDAGVREKFLQTNHSESEAGIQNLRRNPMGRRHSSRKPAGAIRNSIRRRVWFCGDP